MGAMGRYIDSLDDEKRDRLIKAQQWVAWVRRDGMGGGCLVGHAEDDAANRFHKTFKDGSIVSPETATPLIAAARKMNYTAFKMMRRKLPWASFNLATERFGIERVVRAIKQRAARRNNAAVTYLMTETADAIVK